MAPVALDAVRAEVVACDRAASRFRADSELTRLNARAGQWVPASERLLDELDVALRAAEVTGGAVDPTIGQALVTLGYDRDFPLIGGAVVCNGEERPAPLTFTPVPGWRTLAVDRRRGRARVPAGVSVDLGATAKARAADLAAESAAASAGCGVLVSLGGDVRIVGPTPAGGWRIRVTDDSAAPRHAPGQTVALTDGGLATSSVTVRRWTRRGRAVHHLVDPATGGPADVVWRTVSVTAASCVDANIASTASIVVGPSAPGWLGAHGLCARLVAADGTVTVVGGWPPDSRPAPADAAGAAHR
jgi:thiamine biosynthesis lipoprotein